MFEEAARTSGADSPLQWWLLGRARAWANPAVLGSSWAMGELAEHREVLMEVVALLVPGAVRLHRAAGKASFVLEVLSGTLLPGPFPPRAEILCPTPFSFKETSLISTSVAGGILN